MSPEVAMALVFTFGGGQPPAPLPMPVPLVAPADTPTDLTKPAPAGWEKVRIDGGPWHFRRIAPEVATPKTGATFPTPGGCGCTAGANCGAAFCKSRGGTGCPQTCPVKGNK